MIATFDYAYLISQGRVIEQGSHQQLLALDGRYRQMWERQQEASCRIHSASKGTRRKINRLSTSTTS